MSLSIIPLVIGVILFYMGRVNIGTLRAQGRHVKAAGVILTLPATLTLLLLNFFIPMAFGSDFDTAMVAIGIVTLLEVAGLLAAVSIAWLLIADPPGAPRLPGILGQLQDEARQNRPADAPARRAKTVTIPNPGSVVRPLVNRESFPNVMDLKQAARYLRVSEAEILRLIEEGKLTASRDNFSYKIARSQLDELR
jgi:excisionase family DNA binding protein